MWIFSTDFHKIPQYQISRKSLLQQPSWYLWAEGRTDVTKLMGVFRDYEKARKTLIFTSPDVFCHFIIQHFI